MIIKKENSAQGFTLIELLVVIAIIGILAAVVLIALNPVEFLRRSRDTQRLSDMNTISSAVKLWQSNNSSAALPVGDTGPYCHSAAPTAAERSVAGTGWIPLAINTGATSNMLATLPVDPSPSETSRYAYQADANGNFELSTIFESAQYTPRYITDGGNDANKYEVGTSLTLDTSTCP